MNWKREVIMKHTESKLLVAVTATIVFGVVSAWSATSPQVLSARKVLKPLPAVEVPAKAAELVAQANVNDRDATAAAVVTAALNVRPTSGMAVVGAVARQMPETAPTAAVTAANLKPKELANIASSAASAAPKQAARIVEALCKAMPAKYAVIASAVAKAAPSESKSVVAAVLTAVPALKPFLDRASKELEGKDASVSMLMTSTETWVAEVARANKTTSEKVIAGEVAPPSAYALAAPQPGPPYSPTPDDAIIIQLRGRNTTTAPPGGGRDYSAP